MKFGVRKPSLKRRFAARTSVKRYVRHNMGIKAPRGMGIVTNPKRALYNKAYNKTSISADRLIGKSHGTSSSPQTHTQKTNNPSMLKVVFYVFFWPYILTYKLIKYYKQSRNSSAKTLDSTEQ